MVRLLVLYGRPRDAAAFDKHYAEVHTPLAKQLAGLRRFTVSREMRPVEGAEPYYLISELDWDDMAALGAAMSTPEGQAVARDVENNLLPLGVEVRRMIYELSDCLS